VEKRPDLEGYGHGKEVELVGNCGGRGSNHVRGRDGKLRKGMDPST